MNSAVAFFIFNRPDVTANVFAAIRDAKPTKLFLIADGARAYHSHDVENVAATRKAVETIDWPCEVIRKFSPINLGCGKAIAEGLDFVFGQIERAIILEDDCLPNPDFFAYCDRLLDHYADDDRIAHIGGDSFHGNAIDYPGSYYFTRYPHVWGWATWRCAWKLYDFDMSDWPTRREDGTMARLFPDEVERAFWQQSFDRRYSGQVDTWDVQWSYALLMNEKLAINPKPNLISNLGFGPDATHTKGRSKLSNLPTAPLDDWTDPPEITPHIAADQRTFEVVFDGATFRRKLLNSDPAL